MTVRPSGTVSRVVTFAAGSRRSETAAAADMCSLRRYVPGWMPAIFGCALDAATKALLDLTTPASARLAPIVRPLSPEAMRTSTAPVPDPS